MERTAAVMDIFDRPLLLILVPLLPVAVVLLLASAHRKRLARLRNIGGSSVLHRLVPSGSFKPPGRRIALLASAAALGAVAAAGPRWGTETSRVTGDGVDIVLAMDASLSMLANDALPTRLESMKQEVRRLRASSHGDRYGVIAFAGRSYIMSPLTSDAGALDLFLDNLDPSVVGQAGSAVSRAILQGTDLLLASAGAGGRVLVVMSDWESFDTEEEVLAAARAAREAGIKFISVGFGGAAGSRIPLDRGDRIPFKLDEAGRVVTTRHDPELQRRATEAAGGVLIAADANDKATRIRGALSNLQSITREVVVGADRRARFQLFLFPALLLVLADIVLAELARGISGGLPIARRARAARGTATATLAAFLLMPVQPEPPSPARARAAIGEGDYPAAARTYREMIRRGDTSGETLYNLGTALLLADSVPAAIDALRRSARIDDAELRYRSLFNIGLARLNAGLRGSGQEREASLREALDAYRTVLLMRPDDADARWNYELALRESEGGGGGGGGAQQQQQQSAPGDPSEEAGDQEGSPEGLGRDQAEQILDNAARDERDVQSRANDRNRPSRPPGGKDW